jgi:dTDP-4-dehydrorhamnose reductase
MKRIAKKNTESMLVIGADGMLGRAVAARLVRDGYNVIGTSRNDSPGMIVLDLAREAAQWTPPPANVAFLCAAITSQETCRQQSAASRAVNVDATFALAEKLVRQGTHVIYPSTNMVLSGDRPKQTADEPYAPRTEYARQKAFVENCLRHLPGTCVVRLTKVFGRGTPLLRGWCESLLAGQKIRPFADMPIAPVPLDFVVRILVSISAARATGIVQVSAAEDISYAAAARFVAKRLGAAEELVQPVTVAESGLPIEYVPRHTTLDISRLRTEFGFKPPCPRDAIELGMKPIVAITRKDRGIAIGPLVECFPPSLQDCCVSIGVQS